jgi:Domain of unknown function (DUF4412)
MRARLAVCCVAAALVVAGRPRAAAGEDLTIVSTVATPRGTTRTETQYLSADRMRTWDDDRDTIVDLRSGKVLLLDDRRKEYSETSLAELRAFLDQMESAMTGRSVFDGETGATASVDVARGTDDRTIAGYRTEQHVLTMGDAMRYEVWTAPDLAPPARYYEARKALYATMGPMGHRFDRLLEQMERIKGLPLATATDYRMRMTRRQARVEATEVRKGAIAEATFAVPAGYKLVDSPFGRRAVPTPRPSP